MSAEEVQALVVNDRPAEQNLIAVIAHAASDPACDIEKMERLMAMHERIVKQQKEQAFMAAMSRLQAKLPQINKEGRIVVSGQERSRYARLEDLDQAIKPLLAEEGFSFSFNEDQADGPNRRYSAKLSHREGHFETKFITLPLDTSGSKNGVQSVGSTSAYAVRYLIKMHLNIVERSSDTDGHNLATITEEQARDIEAAIDELKIDFVKFLGFMGAASVRDILATDLKKAANAIEVKRRNVR